MIRLKHSKVYSNKGCGHKNLSGGFYWAGKECSDSKNSDVSKTAESGNFKTVNYIVIRRFLTIGAFHKRRHHFFEIFESPFVITFTK